MEITIFNNSDIKKSGGFKKKNNIQKMNKTEFKQYVKTNNLTLSKGYIDNKGFLSNGNMFICSYNGLMVGVTGIINEVQE